MSYKQGSRSDADKRASPLSHTKQDNSQVPVCVA